MKLSKNGSIYWLATLGDRPMFVKTDICTVTKKVFGGILFSMIIIFLGTLAGLAIGLLPFHAFMFMVTGVFLMTEPLEVLLLLSTIILITGTVYYSFSLLNKARKGVVHKVESLEFTKTVYKSIKEKTCFLVEVE